MASLIHEGANFLDIPVGWQRSIFNRLGISSEKSIWYSDEISSRHNLFEPSGDLEEVPISAGWRVDIELWETLMTNKVCHVNQGIRIRSAETNSFALDSTPNHVYTKASSSISY
jgi:hypothetical protein